MAIIKELKGDMPKIGERAFLAETATIIGTVEMGDDCSIWYGAVLRGDVGAIRIGNRVNIQDNAVLHATYQQSECIIGDDVSIGHGANVHGCVIGNDVIIGMGAIVMDNTVVPDNFAKSKNEASVENAAVLDILNGDYKAAAQKLSGKKTFNAVLAQILVGNNSAISSLECSCAKSSYLRAVAAARQGNASAVKAELEKVAKNEKLAQRAAKDVEFAQFR